MELETKTIAELLDLDHETRWLIEDHTHMASDEAFSIIAALEKDLAKIVAEIARRPE